MSYHSDVAEATTGVRRAEVRGISVASMYSISVVISRLFTINSPSAIGLRPRPPLAGKCIPGKKKEKSQMQRQSLMCHGYCRYLWVMFWPSGASKSSADKRTLLPTSGGVWLALSPSQSAVQWKGDADLYCTRYVPFVCALSSKLISTPIDQPVTPPPPTQLFQFLGII